MLTRVFKQACSRIQQRRPRYRHLANSTKQRRDRFLAHWLHHVKYIAHYTVVREGL